jgi:mxaA protein
MKRHAALLCSLLLTGLPSLAAGPPTVAAKDPGTEIATEVSTQEPRAFGYQVGDQFSRQVFVRVPATWQLDPASLPSARRGQPIELRQVRLHSKTQGATVRHKIELHYQVFHAPPAVRVLELAPWWLKFNNGERQEELRVEAWPITVAPLVPLAVNNRQGLGDMQPDAPPPLINTQAQQRRLLLYATLALLLATVLAVLHWGPPWRAARHRPFGQAGRALRAMPTQPNIVQWRAALRCVHQALNRSAGSVVFRHNLSAFIEQQPRFAPLQNELAGFLDRSQQVFFGQREPSSEPTQGPQEAWAGMTKTNEMDNQAELANMAGLTALVRRLHDADRGLL